MKIILQRNRHAGFCSGCGRTVDPGDGAVVLMPGASRNTIWHHGCLPNSATTPEPAPATPEPAAAPVLPADLVDAVARRFLELVPAVVAENLDRLAKVAEIKVGTAPAVKLDKSHAMLPTILTALMAGANPFLVGPAGSGKTTMGEQIAKVLKRKFYMASRVTSEYKLTGFRDATGNVVRTAFREAFEHGGVFLFDEVDASDPDALTSFNAALANGYADFPDGMVQRHKDFAAIAAGNTFGRGADRQYVGRNQLDAATLDRFQVFEVDYDERLEAQLSGDPEWTKRVQAIRAAVEAEKVRHVVSPRASIIGARMLAAGMERRVVEEACIWKGLDAAQRQRIISKVGA